MRGSSVFTKSVQAVSFVRCFSSLRKRSQMKVKTFVTDDPYALEKQPNFVLLEWLEDTKFDIVYCETEALKQVYKDNIKSIKDRQKLRDCRIKDEQRYNSRVT